MVKWIVVFMGMVILDYVWARYTTHVANRNAPMASFFGGLIVAIGALTIVSYTQDLWLVIPATLGAATGTYLTVRYVK